MVIKILDNKWIIKLNNSEDEKYFGFFQGFPDFSFLIEV